MTVLDEPRTPPPSTAVAATPKAGTLVTDIPRLRAFWYPVAQLDGLSDGPVHRRLLGVDLVVWSPQPGEVRAAPDRCPHRDAQARRASHVP